VPGPLLALAVAAAALVPFFIVRQILTASRARI
jgi:hypothetical protein